MIPVATFSISHQLFIGCTEFLGAPVICSRKRKSEPPNFIATKFARVTFPAKSLPTSTYWRIWGDRVRLFPPNPPPIGEFGAIEYDFSRQIPPWKDRAYRHVFVNTFLLKFHVLPPILSTIKIGRQNFLLTSLRSLSTYGINHGNTHEHHTSS